MSGAWVLMVIIIGCGVVFLVVSLTIVAIIAFRPAPYYTCPKCEETGALEWTGAKEQTSGFFTPNRIELKCKFCEHTLWKDQPSDGGGFFAAG